MHECGILVKADNTSIPRSSKRDTHVEERAQLLT